MRFAKYFLSLCFSAVLFYSCNPCNYLDCLGSNYSAQFRIVSAVDGTDLLFGQKKIYDQKKIRFFSLNGTDTSYFESEAVNYSNAGFDSILQVNFFPQQDTAFMKLSNGDVDTIAITYKSMDTKCCGNITEIAKFSLNGNVDLPGNRSIQIIKK